MERMRLTKDDYEEMSKEKSRLVGGVLNYDFKDSYKGYITAEFNFNVIDVFKQHSSIHNLVVVSFRKDMIYNDISLRDYILP